MANKLDEFKLGSRCTIKSSKRIFAREYVDEGIPFFRSKDVIDKALGVFGGYEYFISQERFNELKKEHGSPEEGDLLLSSVGNRSGQPYVVRDEGDFYFKDGNIIWISEFNGVDSDFLAYWFKSHIGQSSLNSVMIGSAQKALTIDSIRNLKVSFPHYEIQKSIAHILGTLDDKIELNRQMNETLEAMAQALFKNWFVDFDPVIDNALLAGKAIPEPLKERAELRQAQLDSGKAKTNSEINDLFPSEFEFTEELGWIPKGWSVGEVGDIVNRLKVKKRYKKSDVISFGEIPVFEQGSNILLGFHNEIADIQADVESPAFIFGDHTCVLNLSLEPFSVSANVIPLVGKNYPTYWVYYAVHGKQSFEEYRRHWMELIIKTTILPTNDAANLYVSHIKHLKEKQMRMLHTSNTLMELRDTLLPKLMSGELRIADAEKLAENI